MKLGLITVAALSMSLYAPSASASPLSLTVEALPVVGLESEFDFENGSTDAVRAPASRVGSVIKTTVLTGVGGTGGVVVGWIAGMMLCPESGPDAFMCLAYPTTIVGTIGGAYLGGRLGFKLAQRGRTRATQVSVAPYVRDEGSGLMFSGQF